MFPLPYRARPFRATGEGSTSLGAGLIVLFIVYTYAFTWGFDRVFGLPVSAR